MNNFMESVRTRQPSVEDAVYGKNTAIACHMANYSYFNKCLAVWNEGARKIQSHNSGARGPCRPCASWGEPFFLALIPEE